MPVATNSRRRGAMSQDADRSARMRKLIRTLRPPGEDDAAIDNDAMDTEEEDAGVTPRGAPLARNRSDSGDAELGGLWIGAPRPSPKPISPEEAKGQPTARPRFMASTLEMPGEDGNLIDGDTGEELPEEALAKKPMKRRGRRGIA